VIPTDDDLLSAEEYLEEHGYLAPTDIGLARGTYTITPAGLRWSRVRRPR
jgi:DNA-binding PadR family transcriptional regulator